MTAKTLYTAKVHTTGGRDGTAKSADGQLDVKLATPGTSRAGTNPETLFAAGWSACFRSAMDLAAKEKGVMLPADTAVDADVNLNLGEDGYFLSARLNVTVPGLAKDLAEAVIERAHQVCPYSKMTRDGIEADLVLT